jgi:peptide/nickel transport system substrate-binding protein
MRKMSKKTWFLTFLILMMFVVNACTPQATPTGVEPTKTSAASVDSKPTATTPAETKVVPTETKESTPVEATTVPATEEAAKDVTLRIGWLGQPDTLNPAYAFLSESWVVFDLAYGTLVTESTTGEYVGALAKEWKHSDDGLVWTFTLKDNIKWHNGEAFSAKDMAWSIQAVMDNPDGWSTLSSYVDGFTGVKAADDKTVEITMEYPVSNMLYRVSFLFAVYQKDFEGFKTSEDLQNFANDKLIGTGPFKLNTVDKDKGILILDANSDFYDGAPVISKIIFQQFDNADALLQALKSGDIDMVEEVPASAFNALKSEANIKAVQEPGRYFRQLIINSAPLTNDPAPIRNKALEDPQVRLAIAMAINKQDLVDIVLQGLGTPGTTIVMPFQGGGFWHNSDIKDVAFDLDKAKQTLEDAGYKLGSDGIRAKGDVKLEFRLQFPSDSSELPRVADLMSNWFKEIGIKTNNEAVDPDALTVAVTPTADFDLVLWGYGPDPDPNFILSVLTTEQFVEGGWSDSGYSNPEYDKLYQEQQKIIDPNERQKVVWKMQEIAFNDRPYIVYWYEDTLQAYRSDRFTGFIESALGIHSQFSLRQVKPVR